MDSWTLSFIERDMKLLVRLIFLMLIAVATSAPCDAAIEHQQHARAETIASSTEKSLTADVQWQRASHAQDHSVQATPHCDSAKFPIASLGISVRRRTGKAYFVLLSPGGNGLDATVDAEPPRVSL